MPNKARRYCQRCSQWATQGNYCDDHAPRRNYKQENARREAHWYDAWYKTKLWEDKRARQLQREPLCRDCLAAGLYVPATEVDHVVPHKGDWNLFIDEDNLQSLCKRSHSSKTATENQFFKVLHGEQI